METSPQRSSEFPKAVVRVALEAASRTSHSPWEKRVSDVGERGPNVRMLSRAFREVAKYSLGRTGEEIVWQQPTPSLK